MRRTGGIRGFYFQNASLFTQISSKGQKNKWIVSFFRYEKLLSLFMLICHSACVIKQLANYYIRMVSNIFIRYELGITRTALLEKDRRETRELGKKRKEIKILENIGNI